MAKVTFKNVLDEISKFEHINKEYLLGAVNEYSLMSDELYHLINKQKVILLLNNEEVPVDNWHNTKVSENDEIVIIPALEGGRKGAWIRIAMAVVIIAVAWYLGPVTAGGTGTLTAGQTAFGYGVGASLALGAISELLWKPDLPQLNSMGGSKSTQTYNWSGMTTTANYDTPIPVIYGTHKVAGNIISLYTERDGDDSYLNMLLGICEGTIDGIVQEFDHTSVCTTSDLTSSSYRTPAIELNDQPIRNYEDVEWWYRNGTATDDSTQSRYDPNYQNKIPYFDGNKMEYNQDREVTTDWLSYTTTKEVDMVTLHTFAPQLYDSTGQRLLEAYAKYKIQYSNDNATWYDYSVTTQVYTPSVSGTKSHLCTCNRYTSGTYRYGVTDTSVYTVQVAGKTLRYNEAGWGVYGMIVVYIKDADGNLLATKDSKISFKEQTYETYDPIYGKRIVTRSVPSTAQSIDVMGYLVTLSVEVEKGDTFTITSVATSDTVSASEVIIKGRTKTGIWKSITMDFNHTASINGRDIYYIRLKRTDGGKSDDMRKENNLLLKSVVETVQGNFIYPYTALLGFRIKATGQLSGSPPNVGVIVRGTKLEVPALSGSETFDSCFWDDTDERWEYNDSERTWDEETWQTGSDREYSNNSMLCLKDIVTNTRYGLGDYLTSSDINVISAIKECSKRYIPYTAHDYFDWWDSGIDSNWNSDWWTIDSSTSDTITHTIDSSARTIRAIGTGTKYDTEYGVYLLFTNTSLKKDQDYTISIELSGVSSNNVTMEVYGMYNQNSGALLDTLSDKGDGTHTASFTMTLSNCSIIKLIIYGGTLDYTIVDVSLTRDTYERYHTWNGVLESGQSAMTVLLEMCDAFRCWPIWYSGVINFTIDKDETPIHQITVGNEEKFSQTFTPLSEIPYRLVGQYTDETQDYEMRSITSKSSLDTLNKLNERTIGLKGLTSRHKAERELKFKHRKVTLQTHAVSIKCGLDKIHAIAGDLVYVSHNLPEWAKGGRILSYDQSNASFTLDATYTFSNVSTDIFVLRYMDGENNIKTATLSLANINNGDSKRTITASPWVGSPCADSIYSIGSTSNDPKTFRIVSVSRSSADEVEINTMEHISGIYSNEATITVVKDTYTKRSNILAKPNPPINVSVSHTDFIKEGIGFIFKAQPPSNSNIKSITVQISENDNFNFETIATINPDRGGATYLNNNLKFYTTYYFRFYSETNYNRSDPIEVTYKIAPEFYVLPPPTGLRIKDVSSNLSQFDGKDVTILWNPVTATSIVGLWPVSGYNLYIYKNSISSGNLLRTAFSQTTSYTYTYDMNLVDSSGSSATNNLIFVIKTLSINNTESTEYSVLNITNSTPDAPSNTTATAQEDAVLFEWDKDVDITSRVEDFKCYKYRTQVESDGWSDWNELLTNNVRRELDINELADQGSGRSNIQIEVTILDLFGNESSASSTNEYCNNLKVTYVLSPTAGLGHFQYIQEALNALPTEGGTLLLKNGTYDLSLETGITNYNGGIVLPDIPIIIQGESHDAIIQNNPGDCTMIGNDITTTLSLSNFTIDSQNTSSYSYQLYLYGTSPGDYTATTKIEYVNFELADNGLYSGSNGDYGVYGNYMTTSKAIVRDCIINGGKGGLRLSGGSLVEIYNNYINGVLTEAIYSLANESTISGNKLIDYGSIGIRLSGSGSERIINNVLTCETNGAALTIMGIYGSATNTLISNNNIIHNPTNNTGQVWGIEIVIGSNSTITKNVYNAVVTSGSRAVGIGVEQITDSNISLNVINIDSSTTDNKGIWLINSDREIINGNNIDLVNNTANDYGIVLDANSDNNQGGDNITYNVGTSISDSGAGNAVTAKDV